MRFNFFLLLILILFSSCEDNFEETNFQNSNSINTLSNRPSDVDHSLTLKGKNLGYIKSNALHEMYSNGKYSIEVTFFFSSTSNESRYIFSNYEESFNTGIRLFYKNSSLYITVNSENYVVYNNLHTDTCYNFSFVDFGDEYKVYLNGELLTIIDGNAIQPFFNALVIGSKDFHNNTNETTDITIDELRLWKYPISQELIQSLMFRNINPIEFQELLGYYNFNTIQDDFILDSSVTYNNNGALIYGAGAGNYSEEICID